MRTETSTINPRESTTLALGGTGKTGRPVAERLIAHGVPTRIASRSGTPAFDRDDPSTRGALLNGFTAAYISHAQNPAIPGATDAMRSFVELAVEQVVQRLVLLSGRGHTRAVSRRG